MKGYFFISEKKSGLFCQRVAFGTQPSSENINGVMRHKLLFRRGSIDVWGG